jgi:ATP-dependent DNA helicase RecG
LTSRHDQIARPLKALRSPLSTAARRNFDLLEQIADLGPTLARAAGALAAALEAQGSPSAVAARSVAAALARFDTEPRQGKVRLVAQGLRVCATVDVEGGPAGKTATGTRRGPMARERRPAGSSGRPETVSAKTDMELTSLKGVGPAVAQRLASRGIETVEDLLYWMPLEYQDRRELVLLGELSDGTTVTTCGVIEKVNQRRARGRGMLEVGLAPAAGEAVALWCVWFRTYPGLKQRFQQGEELLVAGQVKRYRDALQVVHPDVLDSLEGAGIRRRYPEVEGVAPRLLEKICTEACSRHAGAIQDGVPESVAAQLELPTQEEALKVLHLVDVEPAADELAALGSGRHPAQQRLVFDELFSLQLAVALRRQRWGRRRSARAPLSDARKEALRALFPFELTGAQRRVTAEILADMRRQTPMHRLLQGDVGSGKTVVAFSAACAAMDSGLQAAIMAPTEILARQHFDLMEPWARHLGFRSALVTASTPSGVKESVIALADAKEIQLLIGTHALLSPRVKIPDLGLAVVDEQHRFGVLQRFRLRDGSQDQLIPHLLLMTATPIPRSMALALYGDLDLSLLDEKPPGRRPPRTEIYLGKRRRATAYRLVGQQLDAGQQVFVVCPLVEESDKLEVADAVGTAQQLTEHFPRHRVGLVHGRLPLGERQQVMDAFRGKELDLLVATTVIEVGIDVPDANVMVVEHAERFGLAQLHQLRGRVGRGAADSHCLLLTAAGRGSDAGARLEVLAGTSDGFEIAEADLTLRGPGEVFGTRQSGLPRLRFADLREHMRLLARAQEAAREVVEADPGLVSPENRGAREVMQRRWEREPLVGAG